MSAKPAPPGAASTEATVSRLREAVEHYRALVEATSDWAWEIDAQGRYTYTSPKVFEVLGYAPEEVLGHTPFEFMSAAEAGRVGALFSEHLERQEAFHELLNVSFHKDGRTVVLETSGVPLFDDHGVFCGYRGIDRDVTVRTHAERRQHLTAAAVQATAEGILVADPDGNVTACNPAFEVMCGLKEADLVGKPPSMLSTAEGVSRTTLWDLIALAPRWRGEGLCRSRSGQSFDVWLTLSAVHDDAGVFTGFVALVGDLTERRAAEATIRYQATHDALTQLTNRSEYLKAVDRALAEARRTGQQAAVLFIDLDGFKAVNDLHGHHVGDLLLSAAARRLERCVRRTDLASRFGGDEFTLLLRGLSSRQVPARVAHTCVQALNEPFRINGLELHVGASVGIGLFPEDGHTVDALVAAADRAMYGAKRAGGSRVHEVSYQEGEVSQESELPDEALTDPEAPAHDPAAHEAAARELPARRPTSSH